MYDYKITNKDKIRYALTRLQLSILDELDRISRKHNIEYSLTGGSLIGAVRDGGIIPWDDDVDIIMTRKNYDKLISIINDEIDHEKYIWLSNEFDKEYQTTPRLCLKNTSLATRPIIKAGYNIPIFVDVFVSDFTNDNETIRTKELEKLKFLRMLTYDRWIKRYNALYFNNIQMRIKRTFYSIFSNKKLREIHNNIIKKYYNSNSEFSSDSSFGHATNIFPSKYLTEYVDIEFEGHKYMITKDTIAILKYWYGENYMEWIPINHRGAWHIWGSFDLGEYAKDFDVPKDYKKYMVMYLEDERLKHIKKLSLNMIEQVKKICQKHNLQYYIVDRDAHTTYKDLQELSQFWKVSSKLAMPRKDYEKFIEIANDELDEDYFFQSHETQNTYWYPHGKLRLNNTEFKDSTIRLKDDINQGFYIDIIPLDNTSNDTNLAKKQSKKLSIYWHYIRLKWIKNDLRKFRKLKFKYKLARIYLCFKSLDSLYKQFNECATMYNNQKTNYYIEPSRRFLKNKIQLNKDMFGNGVKHELLGHTFTFPENLKDFYEATATKTFKHYYNRMKKMKNDNLDNYIEFSSKVTPQALEAINKRVKSYNFALHDHPDYILTCLTKEQDIEKTKERFKYVRKITK